MNISVHAEADVTAVTHNDLANAVRFLAVDAIETSQSGHPGLPMGMADVATVLFSRFLKFDSAHPNWPDRDRFVLSAGHGSMLLYALLHLTGGDVSLDDIKAFRQWGSKTPGIPNMATRAASRPRRDHWGRALRPRSAWRSPNAWPMRGMATGSSIISPMSSPATAA